jgi:hypothetical protein
MTVSKATKVLNFFHILNRIILSFTFFVIIALVSLFYIMSKAPDPVDVVMTIADRQVKFGEYLEIEHDNDRHQVCPTITNISLFDSQGTKITFPEIPTQAVGPAIRETTKRKIKIDRVMRDQEVVAGPARYRLALTWKCPGNYYQALFPKTHVYDDIPFEITE